MQTFINFFEKHDLTKLYIPVNVFDTVLKSVKHHFILNVHWKISTKKSMRSHKNLHYDQKNRMSLIMLLYLTGKQ